MRQILSFITLAETWDVDSDLIMTGPEEPLKDREFMTKVRQAYRDWWKERRRAFVVGPYHHTAEGVWLTLTRPEFAPEKHGDRPND